MVLPRCMMLVREFFCNHSQENLWHGFRRNWEVNSFGWSKPSNLVDSCAVGWNRVNWYCSVYEALMEVSTYMCKTVCGSLKPDRDSPGQSASQALATDHELFVTRSLLYVFWYDILFDGHISLMSWLEWWSDGSDVFMCLVISELAAVLRCSEAELCGISCNLETAHW